MSAKDETKLVKKMRDAGMAEYGDRLVIIKYHGGPYSTAGVSDLLACLDGNFGACEVKAPQSYGGSVERAVEKGPTPKQLAFLDRVSQAGGTAVVVADVDGFLAFLQMLEGE